jgi:hypothetical protein
MKKVIFALPGREFSGRFLQGWTELVYACLQNGIQPIMSQHYSPLLYYVRNMCLGGDNLRGIDQKPFGGQFDYDYIMWIDSDVVFTPDHFFKLLQDDKDIVSGLYMMSDNTHYATVEDWDDEFFLKHGHFQFLNREMVQAKQGKLFTADYTGFGWVLIKKGVFESLQYPWFQPIWTEYEIDGKIVRDFTMEDVAFCKMIKEKGYDVWIDPSVIVGHEKMMVL